MSLCNIILLNVLSIFSFKLNLLHHQQINYSLEVFSLPNWILEKYGLYFQQSLYSLSSSHDR